MPRLKLTSDLAQALSGGPMWEPGEEQDLTKVEAAPYLRNANWAVVETKTEVVDAPTPTTPEAAPVAPQEAT